MQMVPNGNWRINKKERIIAQQVDRDYYHDNKEVKPEWIIPIPRSSIHLRYDFIIIIIIIIIII